MSRVPDTARRLDSGTAQAIVSMMIELLADGKDHPELWSALPDLLEVHPMVPAILRGRLALDRGSPERPVLQALLAICGAILGEADAMAGRLAPIAEAHPGSALLRGALGHVRARASGLDS